MGLGTGITLSNYNIADLVFGEQASELEQIASVRNVGRPGVRQIIPPPPQEMRGVVISAL